MTTMIKLMKTERIEIDYGDFLTSSLTETIKYLKMLDKKYPNNIGLNMDYDTLYLEVSTEETDEEYEWRLEREEAERERERISRERKAEREADMAEFKRLKRKLGV